MSLFIRNRLSAARSTRAIQLAIAEMSVKGVSTRDVQDVLEKFGLESLSSTQVSRASKLLDHELEQWRNRPLGVTPYIFLDARYEKTRIDGVVRDVAILSAIGVGWMAGEVCWACPSASRKPKSAEIHWRDFLDSLVERGLRGVRFIHRTIIKDLARREKRSLAQRFGGAANFIWRKTPFITRPITPSKK